MFLPASFMNSLKKAARADAYRLNYELDQRLPFDIAAILLLIYHNPSRAVGGWREWNGIFARSQLAKKVLVG